MDVGSRGNSARAVVAGLDVAASDTNSLLPLVVFRLRGGGGGLWHKNGVVMQWGSIMPLPFIVPWWGGAVFVTR